MSCLLKFRIDDDDDDEEDEEKKMEMRKKEHDYDIIVKKTTLGINLISIQNIQIRYKHKTREIYIIFLNLPEGLVQISLFPVFYSPNKIGNNQKGFETFSIVQFPSFLFFTSEESKSNN